MTQQEWDPALDTGDPTVDQQHRELFALFNELEEAGGERHDEALVRRTLDRLTEYTLVHFELEERLMAESGYAEEEINVHKTEHRLLTEQVRERVLDHRRGEGDMESMVAFLRGWLAHHIREVDFILVRHLARERERAGG